MIAPLVPVTKDVRLTADVCQRAVGSRDPRFDGVFFVGITTTRIYCRPVCPARVTYPERRRFFPSAAAAERAGFRPCLRCRPELAPGRALCDAVSRLAAAAAHRIAAGGLNGRGVKALARDLSVSERHLRRALGRELGISPVELAQTHRLLLAKRLLADTDLSITRIAYASGFQSLRRFNSVFRERYRMAPSAVRRVRRQSAAGGSAADREFVHLTLSYRPPLAWHALLAGLARDAIAGVDLVDERRYGRTVRVGDATGVVIAEDAPRHAHLRIAISDSLVPAIMPLLAMLRTAFDLDAEPAVIDEHLARTGLRREIRTMRGMRVPGGLDGFDVAWRILLASARPGSPARAIASRVVERLGAPLDTGVPALCRLTPGADRLAEAGARHLVPLGVSADRAVVIAAVARLAADGGLQLQRGADVEAIRLALRDAGVDEVATEMIVMRSLDWPDAFPAADASLRRAAGVASVQALLERAEAWRPWRAYAAMHLWRRPDAPDRFTDHASMVRVEHAIPAAAGR